MIIKKYFFSLLLTLSLFLIFSSSFAFGFVSSGVGCSGGGVAAAEGCSASTDTKIVDLMGTSTDYSENTYTAQIITLSSTTTITSYVINGAEDGVGSFDVSLYTNKCTICDGSDDEPNTEVSGTAKTGISTSPWPSFPTYGPVAVDLDSPKTGVTAGKYWLYTKEASGEFARGRSVKTGRRCTSADGTTWNCEIATGYDVEIWGCQ